MTRGQLLKMKGFGQISGEEALQEIAGRIIENNPAAVTDYKKEN